MARRKPLPKCWIGRARSEYRLRVAHWFAANHGYTSRAGGWIYNQAGRPVAQGWDAFHDKVRGAILTDLWGTDFLEAFGA